MALSTNELNRIADAIVASDLTCRIHSASPGANGTSNRVGTLTQTLSAGNWTDAAAGGVTYKNDVNFGVVDATTGRTITHLSIWRGSTYIADAQLSAAVSVGAGSTFRVVGNTIRLNGSTA